MKALGFIGFRVDDRMIHGIVATQWVPNLKATRAMVIDDEASTNDIMRSSMKMATPAGVEIPHLNLGDVTQNTGETTVLAKTVRVNLKEKEMLKEMRDAGVKITAQFTPSDSEADVSKLLD